ncbi:unnamed protein product [Darwinula stevensoni]|uniref:Uncharacterized protein n=1 Tax=Darwinula stevensoni TaxID=69355 RepID=A0A7R9A1J3_9CRUS|nr:unnamed protein product [Darwinula stevensoni]CAG0883648.1 unnamed protein product [Darwinula stevensoni]
MGANVIRELSLKVHTILENFFYKCGYHMASRPWAYIGLAFALVAACGPGMLLWKEENAENVEAWFQPDSYLYRTQMWMRENFPEGVRYENLILTGPNVLTPEFFKYMARLDKKIRLITKGGHSWEDVCARPDEFLEGKAAVKNRPKRTSDFSDFQRRSDFYDDLVPVVIAAKAVVGNEHSDWLWKMEHYGILLASCDDKLPLLASRCEHVDMSRS